MRWRRKANERERKNEKSILWVTAFCEGDYVRVRLIYTPLDFYRYLVFLVRCILVYRFDANLVITWSRNPHAKTPIPGKPSKSGLIGV
jgi:hypothetical protein